jgi:hypothetical protein
MILSKEIVVVLCGGLDGTLYGKCWYLFNEIDGTF